MNQHERDRRHWTISPAISTIIRFFLSDPMWKRVGRTDAEGAETWVELYLRPVQGVIDREKEVFIRTREGKVYPVEIELQIHFFRPTLESSQDGSWQAGDWIVTVSGIAYEQLHDGDVLFQEKNANKRVARQRKSTQE